MAAILSPVHPSAAARHVRPLDTGWEAASTAPGAATRPADLDGLAWWPATVPGTAAGVLVGAEVDLGKADAVDPDALDWWFRTRFEADRAAPDEQVLLHLDGLATIAEVYLDGALIATSESMFVGQSVDIGDRLDGGHELAIVCRALAPQLAVTRRPRARWRTRVVADGNLRWFRTTLLGRAPGFAPGPAVVGPWRPIRLERRRAIVIDDIRLRATVEADGTGRLDIETTVTNLDGQRSEAVDVDLDGPSGQHHLRLTATEEAAGPARFTGSLRIPGVALWWPHTHGVPALHAVRVTAVAGPATLTVDAGHVGFRTIAAGPHPDHDLERDGLDVHINGQRIFARGAVWTPIDPVDFAPTSEALRSTLELVRDGGLNMLRLPGTGVYETPEFHDLCDELGILVWQDLLFANLDYPFVDEDFRVAAEHEASVVVDRLAAHPSTTVVCGNSEIEQQVAMLGLAPELGQDPFFGTTLPAIVAAADSDAITVRSAPFGGDLPFRPDRGVANYYGVGGYRRPLSDARTAGVRFASECLAFANVPDGSPADAEPWVPRDVGADWDFADVRDHYLELLYEVDAAALRQTDPERYLALSRMVTGEVMAEVFGEWRRAGSPCGGGLVLWLRDLRPGSGWGLLDHRGEPKATWHVLRRAFAPIALWTTDEGLGGIAIHVANDRPEPLRARLRVAMYRDLEVPVGHGEADVDVAPRGGLERDLEGLIGRFVDASWAYRFGPPAQDVIVVTLERTDGPVEEPLAQAVRFPAGRSVVAGPVADLGLDATAHPLDDGRVRLAVSSRRLAYGVRVETPGFIASDDAFAVEPGRTRHIDLRPRTAGRPFVGGSLRAVGLDGFEPIRSRGR